MSRGIDDLCDVYAKLDWATRHHDDDISGWAIAGIALGAALIAGLAVALIFALRRRPG